jgi:putative toxin-antitoxin system antitoxin component (TIGR02293 family)
MKHLTPNEFNPLALVERIFCLADDAFGDKDKAYEWFHRPNRFLKNLTPLDLLHSAKGILRVETLLGRIQHGIYS